MQVGTCLHTTLNSVAGLTEVLRKHTFVGMADETLALLQHSTRLYLLNIANLSKDMFYQQVCPLIHSPGLITLLCMLLSIQSCPTTDSPRHARRHALNWPANISRQHVAICNLARSVNDGGHHPLAAAGIAAL